MRTCSTDACLFHGLRTLLLILSILPLGVISVSPARATPFTTVGVFPPSSTACVGQDFCINVTISDVLDLYGWEFKLNWSEPLLDAVSIVEGPFLESCGGTFFYYNFSAEGHVVVDCTLLGPVHGASGRGTLATIQFHVENVGQCLLDLYDVSLLDSREQTIASDEVTGGYGYFTDPYDVAVTDVVASPIIVLSGDIVNINATVQNQGGYTESFNVTAHANAETIGIQPVTLDTGSSTIATFTWNTSDLMKGDYTISASASIIEGEFDTSDNTHMAENAVTVLCLGHDVAITNVQPAKTVIGQGYNLLVEVTVKNYGTYGEAFDTTACSNQTVIQTQAANLASGQRTQLTFTWNTVNSIRAYTISANATILPEENDISDNALVYGIVKVSCIGDINGDYVTDAKDYQLVKKAIPSIPGSLKWYPNADINCDGAITAKDYQLVKSHIPSYA